MTGSTAGMDGTASTAGCAGSAEAERRARCAWSRLAEPGDPVAAKLVAAYGVVGALDRLPHLSEGSASGRFGARLAGLDVDRDLARGHDIGARFVVPGDPDWPAGVDDLPIPPLGLWVRGPVSVGAASARSVAIVGARAATAYGEGMAAQLAAGLGSRGYAVVSGAAFGVDAAGHRGALGVEAATIAVLAGGVDRPYPAAHARLLEEIARVGAVISEAPPGAAPMKQRFLLRNRLIAAMTQGTVVVEAGLRSGSRNTAGTAAELCRVVMAVPGPVTSMSSAGCHEMIRAGLATLVTDVDEVAEMLGVMGDDLVPARRGPARRTDGLDDVARRVQDALPSRSGSPVARLAQIAGLGERDVRAALGRLELDGLAVRDGVGWRRIAG
ncbi:MAG: DNA-protecting protein DprA [Austwickia sp.]|jgi:DNA processing protein|nr:MAG: DNA-protecting protein DprA [Austwickia sp.]